jgi:hypothetical protein
MKIKALLVLLGLFMYPAFSAVGADSDAENAGTAAALRWLPLIDNGGYSQSWKEASTYFQGAVSEKNWKASLDGVRRPLGKLVSRKVKTVKQAEELPGAPDGQYVVMQFETSFENKKFAIETVVFMLQKDGKWKAAGYFIK